MVDGIYIALNSALDALKEQFGIHISSETVCYLIPCQIFRDQHPWISLKRNAADTWFGTGRM